MTQKRFHRHYAVKGPQLFWIIFAYLILVWFFPVLGWAALVCMIGPVLTSVWKGRFWCGNVCPRGNMYDRLLSKYSPHRPIPRFVCSFGFRLFMVFWNIILLTTVVGITLSFIYAPRTWCSFCPMGTLSSWVAPKKAPLPKAFKSIHVGSQCEEKCMLCARVCPMQLTPYSSRGEQLGYLHPDCLKCRKCEKACPTKIINYTKEQ